MLIDAKIPAIEMRRHDKHNIKAFIRADSWRTGILAKFHIKVKGWATVDARGYVIPCHPVRRFARNASGCRYCIYKRGFCTLPSDFDRAMREASVRRAATDTDVHAFLHINIRAGRCPGQKPQSDIMTLHKHLKNEKPAHAETSAMQYPASQPDHTSIIPGHLIHTIIRPALLLILSLFSSFSALAYDCKVDGIYYDLNNDDKTASVTYMGLYTSDNKDAYVGNIIIPESITYSGTTYSVTSIGDNVFWGCSGLTSVTIPNSVSYIGNIGNAATDAGNV